MRSPRRSGSWRISTRARGATSSTCGRSRNDSSDVLLASSVQACPLEGRRRHGTCIRSSPTARPRISAAVASSRAYRLLLPHIVHTEAQNIVRTIRRALDMTQTEFAHALGWSPSTISRWESGRAEPDRLSLKIILAFGEERRVRYRPRGTAGTALAAPDTSLPATIGALVHRPALEVLPPASSERPWGPYVGTERPRFEAALSFRVAMHERRDPMGAQHPGWLRSGGIVVAALCALTVIGAPMIGRSV